VNSVGEDRWQDRKCGLQFHASLLERHVWKGPRALGQHPSGHHGPDQDGHIARNT
jgi:hypothetical protein